MSAPRESFEQLADRLFAGLSGDEVATLWLAAEQSDFVRFNQGRVRQPGSVDQRVATLRLVLGRRHASAEVTLSGDLARDQARLEAQLGRLREVVPALPEDPHLLLDEEPRTTEQVRAGRLPEGADAVDAILEAGGDYDLVGIWASGDIHRAFASSRGHRCWFSSQVFDFDFSLYAQGDKAAKASYAGDRFEAEALRARIDEASRQLEILERPAKTIEPGRYRAYLAPAAIGELLGLLTWGAFGEKAHRTKQTALLRMIEDDARLAEGFTLVEDVAHGHGPDFLPSGFSRPARVPLIEGGRLVGTLAGPRSAREYDVPVSAGDEEQPSALDLAAGDLPRDEVLSRLGTGLYVTNVWYTNYSDPTAGRITGMTRFATMWVEDGRVVAPLSVMRFDDTLFRMFGSELEALTAERDLRLDSGTYFSRSTASMRLPGALVGEMAFTL